MPLNNGDMICRPPHEHSRLWSDGGTFSGEPSQSGRSSLEPSMDEDYTSDGKSRRHVVGARGPGAQAVDADTLTPDDVDTLVARNAELEAEINKLQRTLKERSAPALLCGYLYNYRLWTKLLQRPWELRYVALGGGGASDATLSLWRTERDALQQAPLWRHSLTGCSVRAEGVRKTRFFSFRLEDPQGGMLLRLSSSSEAEGRKWLQAMERVGCIPLQDAVGSPSESASGMAGDAGGSDAGTSERGGAMRQRRGGAQRGGHGGEGAGEHGRDRQGPHAPHRQRSGRFIGRACAPAHRHPRESPLSSDAIFAQSHAGLFNLCIVVLLAVNSRLIVENIMKYGLLMNPRFWLQSSDSESDRTLLRTMVLLPLFALVALLLEKLAARRPISEKLVSVLHFVNSSAGLVYPSYAIAISKSALLPGLALMFAVVILWMKLVSYAHVNHDARELRRAGQKPEPAEDAPLVEYPGNVNVRNMIYFCFAPTLCYQLGYPRSRHVRKRWLLRQLAKLVIFNALQIFIIEQYINPTIKNSRHPLKGAPTAANVLFAVERVLKLSIPTLYVWLCMFYCFFHLWLNIVAELMGFGDREFYKDWWNARTVEEYWRLWNMPVHKWMVRHVYFPCLRLGLSKPVAVLVVFLISAVLHEVVVGIPCHMLRCWAFLGILFQVPLVWVTNYLYRRFNRPMVGNMIFWFFFCIVGQPICVLLYYHDVVTS